MKRRAFIHLGTGLTLASCQPARSPLKSWNLFSTAHHPNWATSPMMASGHVSWQPNQVSLQAGDPMTGIQWRASPERSLPMENYEMSFEARRVEGSDFFATLTFPVGHPDQAISLVLGGWGGTLIGISCIDGYDASENSTTSHFKFQNGTWYQFEVQLLGRWLKVWQDQRLIIHTNLKGRQLSLRGGEIVHCLPLGFASYLSHGEIRHFTIREILP